MKKMKDLKGISGKTILLKVDFNIPLSKGRILDNSRIKQVKPTIDFLLNLGAKIIIISHLGRPKNGYDKALSFENLIQAISEIMGINIGFCKSLSKTILPSLISFEIITSTLSTRAFKPKRRSSPFET